MIAGIAVLMLAGLLLIPLLIEILICKKVELKKPRYRIRYKKNKQQ